MDYQLLNQNQPFFILGPCALENEVIVDQIARFVAMCRDQLAPLPVIFKASFDKANRNSIDSYRGPGLQEGLKILTRVKKFFNLPILTDIHECSQAELVAEVADIIQIPAFLCRQTDLVMAAGRTGRIINIKKGQFLDPDSMIHIIRKVESAGNHQIVLTERGASFGYQNLVVDYRSLVWMQRWGYPVIFDATHSVQRPGSLGGKSGGDAALIPYLARAAAAIPAQGFFMEIHPNPELALSDGLNTLSLEQCMELLPQLIAISRMAQNYKKTDPLTADHAETGSQ